MTNPVPGYKITTPYGKAGWSCGFHTGADLAAPMGTPIVAAIAGQIRHRNYGSAFGNHQFAISPDPGQPFADGEAFYAHTTDRPPDGQYVTVGQLVAHVGSEGNSTGPHLHFEYHPEQKNTWGCHVVANPQPLIDHQGGTQQPPSSSGDNFIEEILMANVIVFYEDNGGIWEANLLAGTRHHISNPTDLTDRKHVLTKSGIPWAMWTAGDVGNSEAFGTKIEMK